MKEQLTKALNSENHWVTVSEVDENGTVADMSVTGALLSFDELGVAVSPRRYNKIVTQNRSPHLVPWHRVACITVIDAES